MSFDLIDILINDSNSKPFEIPKSIPDDAKPSYHYAKLCGYKPFISIIGSYSVGKSSFLNTLSNKEIAPSDTSKTTSIPMFIKNGKSNILIKTSSSKTINLEIDYLESIVEQVKHNPDIDFRRYIDFLVLTYDEFPYEDIILVDTPGYSGGDDDYEMSKAIMNISDGIIFMFDASRGALTHEDLEIIKYAREKNTEVFIIANKIDKVWENKEEILKLIRNSLAEKDININKTNICYFSNDPDFENQITLEFNFIKNFIKEISSKEELKLDPLRSVYWNHKGWDLVWLSKYSEAIECFDKAIELEPSEARYCNNKGWALYNLSKYSEALECFDKATKFEPNKARYWKHKGWALIRLSKYSEALECFDKAIEFEPNEADYWEYKGLILGKLSKYQEALECYDKTIELYPNKAEYWKHKGWALAKLSKYSEALECFDKAIEFEPNEADYWEYKGVALNNLSKYSEAEKCFAKAKELEK